MTVPVKVTFRLKPHPRELLEKELSRRASGGELLPRGSLSELLNNAVVSSLKNRSNGNGNSK